MPGPCTLVVGATSDIGAAICQKLAQKRNLLLHGRDAEWLSVLRASLVDAGRHHQWLQDLGAKDRISDSLISCLREPQREVEALVFVAGIFRPGLLQMMTETAVRDVFQVSLFSAIEITRLLASRKVNARNLRSVVYVSSIAPLLGSAGYSIYAAAKGALTAFCKSIAVELAPQVRVNCVSPGGIETRGNSFMRSALTASGAQADYPLGPGRCADVADAVNFLLSEEARWITGQNLIVDGGRTLL